MCADLSTHETRDGTLIWLSADRIDLAFLHCPSERPLPRPLAKTCQSASGPIEVIRVM